MKEAFALQKLLTFFQQKYWHIWDIKVWNFNKTLTNDVVVFEQLAPDLFCSILRKRRATTAVGIQCKQIHKLIKRFGKKKQIALKVHFLPKKMWKIACQKDTLIVMFHICKVTLSLVCSLILKFYDKFMEQRLTK